MDGIWDENELDKTREAETPNVVDHGPAPAGFVWLPVEGDEEVLLCVAHIEGLCPRSVDSNETIVQQKSYNWTVPLLITEVAALIAEEAEMLYRPSRGTNSDDGAGQGSEETTHCNICNKPWAIPTGLGNMPPNQTIKCPHKGCTGEVYWNGNHQAWLFPPMGMTAREMVDRDRSKEG